MAIQFFLHLNSALVLSILAFLLVKQCVAYVQRQPSPIAIPVKVRQDR
jgi:hypothetical protein